MQTEQTPRAILILRGLVMGAGLMYLLDPRQGRRRRAMVVDQLRHASRIALRGLARSSRDFNHRTRGFLMETKSRFVIERLPDDVLIDRVRSKIGRAVLHPHAVRVTARNGSVTLSGPVREHEVDNLLACAAKVRGVRGVSSVRHDLEVRSTEKRIPGLQEHQRLSREMHWLNKPRVLSGTIVGSLLASELYFSRRRKPIGAAASAGLLALYARGFDSP